MVTHFFICCDIADNKSAVGIHICSSRKSKLLNRIAMPPFALVQQLKIVFYPHSADHTGIVISEQCTS